MMLNLSALLLAPLLDGAVCQYLVWFILFVVLRFCRDCHWQSLCHLPLLFFNTLQSFLFFQPALQLLLLSPRLFRSQLRDEVVVFRRVGELLYFT